MTENGKYPNIKQALLLVFALIILQTVLGIPLALIGVIATGSKAGAESFVKHPAALAVVNLIAFSLILLWGLRKTDASFQTVFPLTPVRLGIFIPIAVTILGVSILVSAADNLLRLVLPVPESLAELLRSIIGSQSSLWGAILVAVIVAPIVEEFLFRGLILRGFLKHYSVKKAILVSAVLFGALHLNPWQLLGATILGVVFAWWFIHTRSLWPCLFGHALNNALPILYGRVLQLKIPGYTDESLEVVKLQPWWFNLLGLVLAGTGLWITSRMFRTRDSLVLEGAVSRELLQPVVTQDGQQEELTQ